WRPPKQTLPTPLAAWRSRLWFLPGIRSGARPWRSARRRESTWFRRSLLDKRDRGAPFLAAGFDAVLRSRSAGGGVFLGRGFSADAGHHIQQRFALGRMDQRQARCDEPRAARVSRLRKLTQTPRIFAVEQHRRRKPGHARRRADVAQQSHKRFIDGVRDDD